MIKAHLTPPLLGIIVLVAFVNPVAAADEPYPQPILTRPPITHDAGHTIEGIATASRWAWHAKTTLRWQYDVGLADQGHQTIFDLSFGLGLPANLEFALAMPVGITFAPRTPQGLIAAPAFEGLERRGVGLGDLRAAILWSRSSATEGGLGFLAGVVGNFPTGDHGVLMGEGAFSAEPFVSGAFQVLSTRVSLNLAYHLRPEHRLQGETVQFEQDDDLIWRFALRVPRKNDIAWSLEAGGAIGVATDAGFWPGPASRPVYLGGGLDFPADRQHRIGLFCAAGIVGETLPDFWMSLRVSWSPSLRDEDADGVRYGDECPLMKEDLDGFQDDDGCPDHDNDLDGFPDDEDACPQTPAAAYSQDGC